MNDIALLSEQRYKGEQYAQAICDTFDVLYREAANGGKVLAVPIHPFNAGKPMYAKHFEKAMEYVSSHSDTGARSPESYRTGITSTTTRQEAEAAAINQRPAFP